MGSKYRRAFTMAELAIGVLLILIIGGPVVMTFRSGIELYNKTEANAEVTNGVRFTVDSFGRRISPMLDHTSEIMVLLDPVIPDPVPKNDNYLFLLNNKVVHRDISGDHFLEGSEHISGLTFTVPSSSVVSPDNYILAIGINASYRSAKLDVEAKQALYNLPVKDGDNIVSDNYVGNVLYFKTPGAHDMSVSFDVYDNATKIKINNSLMPKGTVILASYDLNITRNGIEVSYTDESSLDWYISDTTGSQREIFIAQENYSTSIRDKYQFLLVDKDNKPITINTFDTKGYDGTAGNFYVRTDAGADIWGPYGVIRARLRPEATTSRGKKITGEPVWSDYVKIGNKTFWEAWLDAIQYGASDGFSLTKIGDTGHITLTVEDGNKISVVIKSNKYKEDATSVTVGRLNYKYLDNDLLYSIWKNRENPLSEDVPSFMTMTNYSVIVDSAIEDIYFYGIILSDTPKTNFYDETDVFNDIGYETRFQYKTQKSSTSGLIFYKYDGSENDGSYHGITKVFPSSGEGNYYHPLHMQNDLFTYQNTDEWWAKRHRILYTVLEYYDKDAGKTSPRFIVRARFLKLTDPTDPSCEFTPAQLSEIKLKDPWFVGPDFYASEPIWVGDFVANVLTNSGKTVSVRHYRSPDNTTVSASSTLADSANKLFYGLKYGTAESTGRIFKAKRMNIKDGITDSVVLNKLSNPARDRYLGLRVYNHPSGGNNFADATFNEINIIPGFSADEIRSILPANGKLYEIEDTIPSDQEASLLATWYSDPDSPARNYNDALFGTDGYSDGSGNNDSRYNSTAPGILGLQHVPGTCTCPLDNEIFKWIK